MTRPVPSAPRSPPVSVLEVHHLGSVRTVEEVVSPSVVVSVDSRDDRVQGQFDTVGEIGPLRVQAHHPPSVSE